ncbi:MAG: hypothetical protein WC346_21195 [Methanogenium sp.]
MKTWIHRTMKSDKDFYQTNPKMIAALFLHFNSIIRFTSVLDPCCGKHAIRNFLRVNDIGIGEFDLYPENNNFPKVDFLKYFNDGNHYDTVIMNPPYSSKYLFLDHALKCFKNIFCLLPEISLNYNIINEKYLSMPRYWGKIKMYPKMFLHEGTEDKFGGTTCYSWLCFLEGDTDELKTEIIHNLLGDKQ